MLRASLPKNIMELIIIGGKNIGFTISCNLKEMFQSLSSEENKTCANISSDIKCFGYALEGKHFIQNVLECLGLRYFIRFCNVAN